MTTQLIAEKFVTDILETAPVAGAYANIALVQNAGKEFQRLQEVLGPLVDGKLQFADAENAQRFHERCAEYLLLPEGNRPPLRQFLTENLLKEAATPEAIRQLAQDIAQISAGVQAAADLLAPDSPGTWTRKVGQSSEETREAATVQA